MAKKKTDSVLTGEQLRKVRKLVKSKDTANVTVAIQLLQSTEATGEDWSEVFAPKIISLLINTWDIDLWNSMAPILHRSTKSRREFAELVKTRIAKKIPDVALFRKKGSRFVETLFERGCDELLELAQEFFPDVPIQIGLPELSVAAAKSLSRHSKSLYLHGLQSLPDAIAEVLSTHNGPWLSLRGMTTLSTAAAESLSTYQGNLALDGIKDLSEEASLKLSNHKHRLDLPSRYAAIVFKQARATFDASNVTLTKTQITELRKLLRANVAAKTAFVLEELETLNATMADQLEVCSSTVLSLLVNSWDVSVWNAFVPLTQVNVLLHREFTELARLRLKQNLPRYHPTFPTELRNQFTVFVEELFAKGSNELLETSEYIIPSDPPIYLDKLSKLSKAAAHQMAKHQNLVVKLSSLSKTAAQILRDAGHG